jgi:hypothetical protein
MKNPDHISVSLKNNFFELKYFDVDPGWRKFGSGIRDKKKFDPEAGINIPDPQHWRLC